ncbi:VPS68 [[Candida] subhashii]|uniref:VPS68 n=1 Tax=[Candida] subhashii TaxID=561895 RepID=A0A8J5QDW2_9ASCO|nr:VPS68 [[Candida] subhashii]KAG7660853.1 VPS68 [[Candida] subhashii]
MFRLPKSAKLRSVGIYTSGALFAIGFWSLVDSAIFSKQPVNASTVHVTFIDWIPFLCSTSGMMIVNSIEKANLFDNGANGNGFMSTNGGGHAWAARVILFLGFSLLAGGLAGSFMVFILKYLMKGYGFPTLGMGVSNVVCNGCIMLSCIILWLAQNIEDEYSYSLAL